MGLKVSNMGLELSYMGPKLTFSKEAIVGAEWNTKDSENVCGTEKASEKKTNSENIEALYERLKRMDNVENWIMNHTFSRNVSVKNERKVTFWVFTKFLTKKKNKTQSVFCFHEIFGRWEKWKIQCFHCFHEICTEKSTIICDPYFNGKINIFSVKSTFLLKMRDRVYRIFPHCAAML